MGRERNQKTYDEGDGTVTVTNSKGETVLQRLARTPIQALQEFKYACRAWFACMDPITRKVALDHAVILANEVPLDPSVEPK